MEMGLEEEMEEEYNLQSTQKGVKFMSFAYILGVISMGFMLLMSVTALAGISILGSVVAMACGSGILTLITLILFIVGVVFTFLGRDEYTLEHSKKVKIALALLVVGIILFVLVGVSPFLFLSAAMSGSGLGAAKMMLYGIQFMALGGVICLALMSVFLIVELASSGTRKILWGGAGANIAAPLIGVILFIMVVEQMITVSPDLMANILFMPFGFSVIGYILFLVGYRKTYTRIKEGELSESSDEDELAVF